MSRDVSECLKAGSITADEKRGIDFLAALEKNEDIMAEGAAMAVTCEQFGLDIEDAPYVMIEAPDGDWWEAAKLPVKE